MTRPTPVRTPRRPVDPLRPTPCEQPRPTLGRAPVRSYPMPTNTADLPITANSLCVSAARTSRSPVRRRTTRWRQGSARRAQDLRGAGHAGGGAGLQPGVPRAGGIAAADGAPALGQDPHGGTAVQTGLEPPDPVVGVLADPVPEATHGAGLDGDGTSLAAGMARVIDFTQKFANAWLHPFQAAPRRASSHRDATHITQRERDTRSAGQARSAGRPGEGARCPHDAPRGDRRSARGEGQAPV